MTDTFNHGEKASFAERLMRLGGESTYRMPIEGRATTAKPIPAAHVLALALGYARSEGRKDDIGPDVAFDIATGGTSYAVRCGRVLEQALAAQRNRSVKRCRPWLRIICWAAYVECIHGQPQPQLRPSECAVDDWDMLVLAGVRILDTLAADAVLRAERAYYRRGERRRAA